MKRAIQFFALSLWVLQFSATIPLTEGSFVLKGFLATISLIALLFGQLALSQGDE